MGKFVRLSGSGLTDTSIAAALVAKGLTDAQARSQIGSASSLAAGLRSVGLNVASTATAPSLAGFYANGAANSSIKTMLARVKAGTGRGRILCLGDSKTVGAGATNTLLSNARPYSWPAILAQQLTTAGYSAIHTSRMADNGCDRTNSTPISTYDTGFSSSGVIVLPASPTQYDTLGGSVFYNSNAGTGSVTLTRAETIDSYDVHYFQAANNGKFTASVDGGAGTVIDTGQGANAYGKATVKCARGANHTLTISFTTGQSYITAIIPYDSTASQIEVLNAGNSSAKIASFGSPTVYSTLPAISVIKPDLTIIMLDTNDYVPGTARSTYDPAMQAIINAAKGTGDVLVMPMWPLQLSGSYGTFTAATQRAWMDATLATASGATVTAMDVSVTTGIPAPSGDYYDQLHQNQTGYALVGQLASQAILSM